MIEKRNLAVVVDVITAAAAAATAVLLAGCYCCCLWGIIDTQWGGRQQALRFDVD